MKNKFRLDLLAIAPYVRTYVLGLPITRSMYFIWVAYMQY